MDRERTEARSIERIELELTPAELEAVRAALGRGDRRFAVALHSGASSRRAWRSWQDVRVYASRLGAPFPADLERPDQDPHWQQVVATQSRRGRLLWLAVAVLGTGAALALWAGCRERWLPELLAPLAVALIGVVLVWRAGGDEEQRLRPLVAGILGGPAGHDLRGLVPIVVAVGWVAVEVVLGFRDRARWLASIEGGG